MNIGDQVIVPDGRIGILIRLENGVATVVFLIGARTEESAFNQADIKLASQI